MLLSDFRAEAIVDMVDTKLDLRGVAYVIIAGGCILAFATAVVPHYSAGYRLLFGVLAAGLSPYLAYGMLTELLRGWALVVPGLILFAAHLWLTVTQRFLDYDGYQGGAVYYVPLLAALALLTLSITAVRRVP